MSISLNVFIKNIQAIVSAKPSYELGHDGRDGKCDCIGLIIGAVRRSGATWTGTHGSNWSARNAMQSLGAPFLMEVGAVVYKARKPGERGWALPEAYRRHPDQDDYYHVGVVTSISPLRITHCTSWSGGSGIKVDTKIGVWHYGGRLDGVDYENKEETPVAEPIDTAVVRALTGRSVRMRARASLSAMALANVPVEMQVDVLQKDGDWWEIRYREMTGWMQAQYLDGSVPAHTHVISQLVEKITLTLDRGTAELLIKALEDGMLEIT